MNKNSIVNYIICMITTFKKVLYVKLSYMERMTSQKNFVSENSLFALESKKIRYKKISV